MAPTDAFELLTRQHDEIEELILMLGGATDPGARIQLVREIADKITAHLASEQEILYPVAGPLVSGEVMCEVMAEHVAIKHLIADLLWLEADDPQLSSTAAVLAALVDGHVQWQEQELFAVVAAALRSEQLADLGARLRASFVISLHIAFAEAA